MNKPITLIYAFMYCRISMGVRGLSTYLAQRRDFFDAKELRDTEVIIDGNNLRFQLYRQCRGLNDCFGGDYDKYYNFVRQFFARLKRCGITPVIVMDGAFDKDNRKIPTVISRVTEHTKRAVVCNPVTQSRNRVFPIFAQEVFIDALRALDIEVHQSSFEADEVIAQLAFSRSCPVISNDSDFYIFDVDLILIDSLDLTNNSDGDTFLACDMYNRRKMLDHYGLANMDLLYLCAALIGNDYIPPWVFDKVFMNIKLVNKNSEMTERHRKIKSLFKYMSREKSVENALNKLLGFMPEKERKPVKEKVLQSVNLYDISSYKLEIISPEFSTINAKPFPNWLKADYHSARIRNWILSIATNRKYFLTTLVEIKRLESVHKVSMPIHERLCQLVMSLDDWRECSPVELYGRVKDSIRIIQVFERDPSFTDNLDRLRGRNEDEKQKYLFDVLECKINIKNELEGIPDALVLVLIVMKFWTSKLKVSKSFVESILFCHFVLETIDRVVCTRSIMKLQECLSKMSKDNAHYEHYFLASRVYKHFHLEERMKTSTKTYDEDLVHKLSQFQALLWVTVALHQLLDTGLRTPVISELLNCTFIYNLVNNYKESLISQELESLDLVKTFRRTSDMIFKQLHCVEHNSVKTKNRKESRKTNNKKKDIVIENIEVELDNSDSDFCDVNNKFSCLKIY